MRLILAASTAVLAASLVATMPGFAQQQPQQQQQRREQTTGARTEPSPIHRSFNSCVQLAMDRGWAESDLYNDRGDVRAFIVNCMRGTQQ